MKAIEENILAKYIFWGPDGSDFEGTEMVLSPSMAQQARFILSTFSAKGFEKCKRFGDVKEDLKSNTGEKPTTKYGDENLSHKQMLLNSENEF